MIGAENRDFSWRKALRKKRISDQIYGRFGHEHSYYNNLHQYSKNKIHCSCPMCSPKTRNKGRRDRKNYAPSLNYKLSDRKRIEAMEAEVQDFTIEELLEE